MTAFNQNGKLIRGPLGKPTSNGGGFQPSGPAIDIAFVNGLSGGPLFATDSNQSTHQHNGNNNSSRISTVRRQLGTVDQVEEFDRVFQCQKDPGFPRPKHIGSVGWFSPVRS